MKSMDETLLTRGVEQVIEKEHLQKRLEAGEKLRVKLGIDPTAKDLHLGHTVVLRKLRQFQDAGHTAVLIIGDFTTLIGDPSGRNEQRPMLTPEQIKENEAAYLELAGKVLDIKKAEVRHNSEWYEGQNMKFLMDLERRATMSQILEREDFQKRLKDGGDVNMLETIYPFLQGYDSVAVKADVELGGTDQTFNLLMGRKIQRSFGMAEQDIITTPLLEGLDGTKKMSKTSGNYIALNDTPNNMYGKIMSIPDTLMEKYYMLLTDLTYDAVMLPKEAKEKLAAEIVKQYYGETASQKAQKEFSLVHTREKQITGTTLIIPSDTPEHTGGVLTEVLVDSELVTSKSEVSRLIKQQGITINGKAAADGRQTVNAGDVVKIGSRRFLKIV